MKKTTFYTLLIGLILLNSCDTETSSESKLTKFASGKVFLVADSYNSTGLIRLDGQRNDLKAVPYHYTDGLEFSGSEKVYFTINRQNGIDVAENITKVISNIEIMNFVEQEFLNLDIELNLHNVAGTQHAQNAYHYKEHITPDPGGGAGASSFSSTTASTIEATAEKINGTTYYRYLTSTMDTVYLPIQVHNQYKNRFRHESEYFLGSEVITDQNTGRPKTIITSISTNHTHLGDN